MPDFDDDILRDLAQSQQLQNIPIGFDNQNNEDQAPDFPQQHGSHQMSYAAVVQRSLAAPPPVVLSAGQDNSWPTQQPFLSNGISTSTLAPTKPYDGLKPSAQQPPHPIFASNAQSARRTYAEAAASPAPNALNYFPHPSKRARYEPSAGHPTRGPVQEWVLDTQLTAYQNFQLGESAANPTIGGWIRAPRLLGQRVHQAGLKLDTEHLQAGLKLDAEHLPVSPSTPTPISPALSTASLTRGRRTREEMVAAVFRCHCGAGYDSHSELKHHELIHSPKRHFCSKCHKAFHTLKDLRRHEKSHNTDPSLMIYCPHIDCKHHMQGFNRDDRYRRHMKLKHGDPDSDTQQEDAWHEMLLSPTFNEGSDAKIPEAGLDHFGKTDFTGNTRFSRELPKSVKVAEFLNWGEGCRHLTGWESVVEAIRRRSRPRRIIKHWQGLVHRRREAGSALMSGPDVSSLDDWKTTHRPPLPEEKLVLRLGIPPHLTAPKSGTRMPITSAESVKMSFRSLVEHVMRFRRVIRYWRRQAQHRLATTDLTDGAHTTARTITDEGYYSLDKTQRSSSPAVHETLHASSPDVESDSSDTDSIRTDKRASDLDADLKTMLVNMFADELLNHLQTVNDSNQSSFDRVSRMLPILLREYSMLLSVRASFSIEEKASIFVRHQRQLITARFRETFQARPTTSDVPELRDKLDLLWGANRNEAFEHVGPIEHGTNIGSPCLYPSDAMAEAGGEDPPPVEDRQIHGEPLIDVNSKDFAVPEIPKARTFLVEGAEFQWLLSRLAIAAEVKAVGTTETEIRTSLLNLLGARSSFTFNVSWAPSNFMKEQYEEVEAAQLSRVICVSGRDRTVQATTCAQYLEAMWPRFGNHILSCISAAMSSPHGVYRVSLAEGNDMQVTLKADSTTVAVSGSSDALVEVGEVLAWLGAACRASHEPDSPAYCLPLVSQGGLPDECSLTYKCSTVESDEARAHSSAACWQQMFRNPCIAMGYPVKARDSGEEGLELPLGMMTTLGKTPWAVSFGGNLMLKGFYTLFAPIKRFGSSVVWHLIVNKMRKRVSYNEGLASSQCCGLLDPYVLETGRHFVGWTQSVDILTGSREAMYEIQRSDSSVAGPGCALANINISAGKYVTASGSFVRGIKDTPVFFTGPEQPYELQVDAASEMSAVFYDTSSKRAWMVDGASALLHISRGWLSSRHARAAPAGLIAKFNHCDVLDGRESALKTLLDERNRDIRLFFMKETKTESSNDSITGQTVDRTTGTWWCWQNLVQVKWHILEQIHDHMVRLRTSSLVDLRFPFGKQRIEGFECVDILAGKSPIQPRVTELQPTSGDWTGVTAEADSIIIFGSDFGELIKPSGTDSQPMTCDRNAPCPVDRDYLVAPLYVLRDISSRYSKTNCGSVRLGRSTYWTNAVAGMKECRCGRSQCSVSVARFESSPSKAVLVAGHTDVFATYPRGAAVFGYQPRLLTKSSKRRRDLPREEDRKRRFGRHTSDSGVDVGSSSSPGDSAAGPSDASQSIRSSGVTDRLQ